MAARRSRPHQLTRRQIHAVGVAILPTALVLTLKGLYLGPAFRLSLALFWALDLAQFVLLPLLSCWALWLFAQVSPKQYGLGRLVYDEDLISALILFGFVTFIFAFGYPVGRLIGGCFAWLWGPSSSFTYAQALPICPAWAIEMLLFYSFSAGLVEEVFYRGLPALYLAARLSPQQFKVVYPLVSALAFALAHWENGSREMIAIFFLGFLAACFYLMIRNLWPFVVGHAFTDLLAYAGVYDF